MATFREAGRKASVTAFCSGNRIAQLQLSNHTARSRVLSAGSNNVLRIMAFCKRDLFSFRRRINESSTMENSEELDFTTGDPLGQWTNTPAEWKKQVLWELAEYINGRAFKPTDFSPFGLRVIKITELKYGISDTTALYEGEYEDRYLLETGDLLFAWSGNPETSLDAFRWRDGQAILNQHIFRVLPREGTDKIYLYFLLKYLRPTFIRTARDKATSMGHVKVSDLKRLIAYIPPLPEQRAIAAILGSLDDKIELNRKMNETLEAFVRALFKSWFVDFDPVRAKAEGRQPHGVDTETAALFPNAFEDSALGKIPKGWKVVPLPEAIEVNPTRLLSKGKSVPYLDMQNMPTRGHRAIELSSRPFGSGMRFINGDTLLARITPCLENGKTAFVDFLQDGQVGWGSTEYIVFHPKPPLPVEYGYYLARGEELRAHAIKNMTGTSGRQRVPASCFDNYLVVVPTPAIAQHFGTLAKSAMAKIRANDEQSQTLATLRDALLPKLMNGEMRVKDAEEVVGAAT
jgi:type I restriction enzyme S subunit